MSLLTLIDDVLAQGAGELGGNFLARQSDFVLAHQQPDGGFRGRLGGGDPYYTDFALRVLALLPAPPAGIDAARDYFRRRALDLPDPVACFNYLNAARLCTRMGFPLAPDRAAALACLRGCALPAGGYARPRQAVISVYATFLAAQCLDLLDLPVSSPDAVAAALGALEAATGGFLESPAEAGAQTNATAAAASLLLTLNALTAERADRIVAFLAAMQGADGGFRAHPAAADGDLLSTFSALLTLTVLGRVAAIDAAGVARFVKTLHVPTGGFLGARFDPEPDIEYTYYGIGVLALLRGYVSQQG